MKTIKINFSFELQITDQILSLLTTVIVKRD